MTKSAKRFAKSGIRRHPVLVANKLVTLVVFCAAAAVFVQAEEYAKLAPYSAIRWERGQPVVKIGEEWFTLVSLDGVAAEDIVAFSRRTFEDKWQKRFEEDLVEVLTRMGRKPKDTVRLVVSPLESSKQRTLDSVAMTGANRRAIYKAASDRDGVELQKARPSDLSIDNAEAFKNLILNLRTSQREESCRPRRDGCGRWKSHSLRGRR
jgi:hypothetical protein